MIHAIKIWPEYFQAIIDGQKTYELRRNDRNYNVGDGIVLNEYDPSTDSYTGRIAIITITGIDTIPPFHPGVPHYPAALPVWAHDICDWALISFRREEQ